MRNLRLGEVTSITNVKKVAGGRAGHSPRSSTLEPLTLNIGCK